MTTTERIAKVCHEANRAWCEVNGDFSQEPWSDARDWQRESAVDGVRGVIEEGRTPEQSHEGWSAHKLAEGWVYGPVKDPELKTHPCLVPYAALPPEQKRKDALFVAVVNALTDSV